MKNILIIAKGFSLSYEPRIINQINALKSKFYLIGIGEKSNSFLDEFHFFKEDKLIEKIIKITSIFGFRVRYMLLRLYLKRKINFLNIDNIDLVIANNLENGVIALILGKPFVFDSHEYIIGQLNEKNLWWRLENSYLKYVLAKVLRAANMVTAEGERVLKNYSESFAVPSNNFFCVPNTPKYHKDINPLKRTNEINFIHHGLASPRRGLDFYITIFQQLPEIYTLTLMLSNTSHSYYKYLLDLAGNSKNIRFIEPVLYQDIVITIANYDVSLVFFNSNNFHHKYMTVPNKFWESLQARLPVIVGGTSAMSSIVKKYNVGFVCDGLGANNFVELIKKISLEEIEEYRINIQKLAFEFSSEAWYDIYSRKIGDILKPS